MQPVPRLTRPPEEGHYWDSRPSLSMPSAASYATAVIWRSSPLFYRFISLGDTAKLAIVLSAQGELRSDRAQQREQHIPLGIPYVTLCTEECIGR